MLGCRIENAIESLSNTIKDEGRELPDILEIFDIRDHAVGRINLCLSMLHWEVECFKSDPREAKEKQQEHPWDKAIDMEIARRNDTMKEAASHISRTKVFLAELRALWVNDDGPLARRLFAEWNEEPWLSLSKNHRPV